MTRRMVCPAVLTAVVSLSATLPALAGPMQPAGLAARPRLAEEKVLGLLPTGQFQLGNQSIKGFEKPWWYIAGTDAGGTSTPAFRSLFKPFPEAAKVLDERDALRQWAMMTNTGVRVASVLLGLGLAGVGMASGSANAMSSVTTAIYLLAGGVVVAASASELPFDLLSWGKVDRAVAIYNGEKVQ